MLIALSADDIFSWFV